VVSYSAVDSILLVFYSPQFILFKPWYVIVSSTVFDFSLFTAAHSV